MGWFGLKWQARARAAVWAGNTLLRLSLVLIVLVLEVRAGWICDWAFLVYFGLLRVFIGLIMTW